MENYFDLFRKSLNASPWFDSELNKKMRTYVEKNIAATNEFAQKLTRAKDFQDF